MNTDDQAPSNELTDGQLDALLANADQELLGHIQARVNPAATLTAMLNSSGPHPPELTPHVPQPQDETAATAAVALITQRTLAYQLTEALVRGGALARELARKLARDFPSGALARLLARDLARELAVARDLARDLDPALARELALARARVRELACISELAGDLARNLDRARARVRELARALEREEMEASGADLSHLHIEDLDVLIGAVWNSQTTWPPDIADQVRARSREISAGVYQVHRGGRDLSDLTHV